MYWMWLLALDAWNTRNKYQNIWENECFPAQSKKRIPENYYKKPERRLTKNYRQRKKIR
jgi:hypothetical protein